jgi:YHS domain-containing protein
MFRDRFLARWLAPSAVVLLLQLFNSAVQAGVCVHPPCRDGCICCIPNQRYFGHFPKLWRAWPDEPRPDKTFPEALGRELIPTPPEGELVPLPREVPVAPRVPGAPEGILPPSADIPIDPGLPTGPGGLGSPFQLEPGRGPGGEPLLPGIEVDPDTLDPSRKPLEERIEGAPQNPPGPAPNANEGGSSLELAPLPAVARSAPVPTDRCEAASGLAAPTPSRAPVEQVVCETPVEPQAQLRAWQSRREHAAAPLPDTPADTEGSGKLPRVGLDGYCPVELVTHELWEPGDPRWSVVHQGRTYLLSGLNPYRLFRGNPERYAPVHAGADPVLALDENCRVPGRTDACVTYKGRLYMFSSQASLARFQEDPKRYAASTPATTD